MKVYPTEIFIVVYKEVFTGLLLHNNFQQGNIIQPSKKMNEFFILLIPTYIKDVHDILLSEYISFVTV